jgi:hypothetical protein
MLSNFTRVRGRRLAAATTVALSLGAGAVALASDSIKPDGDSGVAAPNLAYGSGARACDSRPAAAPGAIVVNYNGNANAAHFAAGELLDVTYTAPDGSGIVVTPTNTPQLPANWDSNDDTYSIPFTTSVPAGLADGGYNVDVTVTGHTSGYSAGDGTGNGRPKYVVNVSCAADAPVNVAPTVSFTTAPTTAVEGDTKTYAYSVVDPDLAQTTSVAAGSLDCGSLGSVSGTPSYDATTTTGTFDCLFPDGLVPATASTVSVQVTDGVAFSTPATVDTVVSNAAPVVTPDPLVLTNATGTACLGGTVVGLPLSFTDAGLADNPWAIHVDWGTNQSATDTTTAVQGLQSLSHTYAGTGSWTVSASVTDKDTGSDTSTSADNAVSLSYDTGLGILQPINYTGPRSAFKSGSTIPVKIRITDCNGLPVSGLGPKVTFTFGDPVPDGTALEDAVTTTPDPGNIMRYSDGQYILNLATKGKALGDYTVTITDPSIPTTSAKVSIKK